MTKARIDKIGAVRQNPDDTLAPDGWVMTHKIGDPPTGEGTIGGWTYQELADIAKSGVVPTHKL
jgi:hypothetical protein